MKKSKWIVSFLTVVFPLSSLSVMAENPAIVLDEITVTANKMEENMQKVPQSISVIDAAEIEEMGLKNSMDVLDRIPGMLTTPDHGIGVTFRGLKRSMLTDNNPVVMYVDGVPSVNTFGFDFSLVNVERIEVLRGPQGTMYGKDAIGAVVNVITKEPDNSWHGRIGSEYGSFNTWHAQASVNGPIVKDTLFLGLGGQYDQTDGWIKNEYPGMNEDVGRNNKHDLSGYLLFTPTDRLRMRLGVDTYSHSYHNMNDKALPYDPAGAGFGYTDLGAFDRKMAEHLALDIEPDEEMKINAQSLAASYAFDRFTLESITTHRVRDVDAAYDIDRSAGSPFDGLVMFRDTTLTSWTEELRLRSTDTTGLRWVAGVYLDKDEDEIIMGMQMPGAIMQAPVDLEMHTVADIDATTQAIFGQVMVPFGQRFELTLGGRYQRINKEMDQNMYILPVQGPFPADVTGMPSVQALDLDKTWNTFLPKVALAWFVSERYTAYASFSQGYMPGGFNFFSMAGGAEQNIFEPQKSTNYEIGIKADHDVWRLNLAVFYMDIADTHISRAIGGGMWQTDNADKAHSLGGELEAAWLPVPGLELSAGVNLIQAEYDDFDLGNVRLDGRDMEGAPSHTLRFSANYHHPGGLYGWAEIRRVGKVSYYDNSAQDLQKADAYTLVSLKLGWLYRNWDIYVFGRNLTDEEYINAFQSSPMTGGIAGFGDPRTVGVGLSYSF